MLLDPASRRFAAARAETGLPALTERVRECAEPVGVEDLCEEPRDGDGLGDVLVSLPDTRPTPDEGGFLVAVDMLMRGRNDERTRSTVDNENRLKACFEIIATNSGDYSLFVCLLLLSCSASKNGGFEFQQEKQGPGCAGDLIMWWVPIF